MTYLPESERGNSRPSSGCDPGGAGRPPIKLLDCTIRDGGLMNHHRFEDRIVAAVYHACATSGIDYMEIGYRASRKGIRAGEDGCWKFCLEEDIRRIVGDNAHGPKLSIMADAGKCDYAEDIVPKSRSVVDMVRVACYIHQIPLALEMIRDAHDKGYETTINLMAVTTVPGDAIEKGLIELMESEARVVYVVDSFGALHSQRTRHLVELYAKHARALGKEVGIHAHNNLQLAFANTLEAMNAGATYLDATMAGLGRGAGNCPMELLIGFLNNPRYHLQPVLECVDQVIEPLRGDLKWGFDLPYMVTGLLNHHPRTAIEFNSAPERGDMATFFASEASLA